MQGIGGKGTTPLRDIRIHCPMLRTSVIKWRGDDNIRVHCPDMKKRIINYIKPRYKWLQ